MAIEAKKVLSSRVRTFAYKTENDLACSGSDLSHTVFMKKTVVLGATPNPERYAYLATLRLTRHGHEALPVGIRAGKIGDLDILEGTPPVQDVDTVTLYLGPDRQPPLYDYIFSLQPRRIIFNPGTENPELVALARQKGIETEEACTLVLLSIGQY